MDLNYIYDIFNINRNSGGLDMFGIIIIYGIPLLFGILFIKNIIQLVKNKRNNDTLKKSTIIKTIIFGTLFISIISFYIWINYMLSRAIVMM